MRRGRQKIRDRQHASRLVLAATFVVFVAIQLAVASTAQVLWPTLRDPLFFDRESRFRSRVASAGETVRRVVMIGSSRTANGFHGRDFEAAVTAANGESVVAFNFGISGSGPVTNLVSLRRLVQNGLLPDVVFLEVFPAHLTGETTPAPERESLHRERLCFAEVELLNDYGFPRDQSRSRWLESNVVPCYGLRLPIRGRFVPNWSDPRVRFDGGRSGDATGWLKYPDDRVTVARRVAGVELAGDQYAAPMAHIDVTGPGSRAVRDALALCRAKSIRAVAVLMPEGTPFRNWYPPGTRDAPARWLDRLAEDHGAIALDARDWMHDEAFADAHHLLQHGAREFTARLARESQAALESMSKRGSPSVSRR